MKKAFIVITRRLNFLRSGTVEQFKSGLPAIRSNAAQTHKANASSSITTPIRAKFPTSFVNCSAPLYKKEFPLQSELNFSSVNGYFSKHTFFLPTFTISSISKALNFCNNSCVPYSFLKASSSSYKGIKV